MTMQLFDPDRHEMQLLAMFEHHAHAETAREALLGSGLPGHAIDVIVADAMPTAGLHPMARLFAPQDEAHEFGEALERGLVILVVHLPTATERQRVIDTVEGHGPIDFGQRRVAGQVELNHASQTRADLQAAPRRPEPVAPPAPPPSAAPTNGTTYTHGVPEAVVRGMTAEEQVLAQAPTMRPEVLRSLQQRPRTGWRDDSHASTSVRSYLAERERSDAAMSNRPAV